MFGRRHASRPRLLDNKSTQQISEVNGGKILCSDDLGRSPHRQPMESKCLRTQSRSATVGVACSGAGVLVLVRVVVPRAGLVCEAGRNPSVGARAVVMLALVLVLLPLPLPTLLRGVAVKVRMRARVRVRVRVWVLVRVRVWKTTRRSPA